MINKKPYKSYKKICKLLFLFFTINGTFAYAADVIDITYARYYAPHTGKANGIDVINIASVQACNNHSHCSIPVTDISLGMGPAAGAAPQPPGRWYGFCKNRMLEVHFDCYDTTAGAIGAGAVLKGQRVARVNESGIMQLSCHHHHQINDNEWEEHEYTCCCCNATSNTVRTACLSTCLGFLIPVWSALMQRAIVPACQCDVSNCT